MNPQDGMRHERAPSEKAQGMAYHRVLYRVLPAGGRACGACDASCAVAYAGAAHDDAEAAAAGVVSDDAEVMVVGGRVSVNRSRVWMGGSGPTPVIEVPRW